MTFQEVYDEHVRFAWRSLRRLGVREADVSDAVQDVFVVVHRKLPEFEGRSKVTTWIYGICLRVARDRRRLSFERRRALDDDALEERVDEGADVGALAERREGLALLERVLDELPIEQRAVFTLFELEQLSGDQIAELCQVPLGTVYSRLRLAREAFRAALGRLQAKERFRGARAGGWE
jgi:RNA polymerase sigma-70 factor (ECF subfamily)